MKIFCKIQRCFFDSTNFGDWFCGKIFFVQKLPYLGQIQLFGSEKKLNSNGLQTLEIVLSFVSLWYLEFPQFFNFFSDELFRKFRFFSRKIELFLNIRTFFEYFILTLKFEMIWDFWTRTMLKSFEPGFKLYFSRFFLTFIFYML